jgi:hypothetical protein
MRALDNHARAQLPAVLHLCERRQRRHDHSDGDAEQLAVIREGEGVIASTGSGDAPFSRLPAQLQQRVARASLLEAPRRVRLLVLEIHVHAESCRQLDRIGYRRAR